MSDDALAKARATESMAEEQSYKYGSAASPPPVRAADVAVQKRRKELSEHEAAAVRKRCAEAASAFDRALAAALVEQGVAEDLIADWSAISGTAAEAAAAKAAAEEKAARRARPAGGGGGGGRLAGLASARAAARELAAGFRLRAPPFGCTENAVTAPRSAAAC